MVFRRTAGYPSDDTRAALRHIRRMTDDWGQTISFRGRLLLTLLLAVVATLAVLDVLADWQSGGSIGHMGLELLSIGTAALGMGWVWSDYLRLRGRLMEAHRSLARARADAEIWRQLHAELVRGLSQAIDQQLETWRLTPAEKEIAFLLLKGLSFKEIAAVRDASERTVRQQALAVYAKSGLAGRAELAAFFLEDLLPGAADVSGNARP